MERFDNLSTLNFISSWKLLRNLQVSSKDIHFLSYYIKKLWRLKVNFQRNTKIYEDIIPTIINLLCGSFCVKQYKCKIAPTEIWKIEQN